jgi:hypothetical protein
MSTRWGSTRRHTDWLTVSGNMTTLTRPRITYPCCGDVVYPHRDPPCRRRRRKWKSQTWDSKIWLRLPRDSDLRKSTLEKALVREGAPEKQDRNCQWVISISSWAPDGARQKDLLIDWPSVAIWLRLRLWFENYKSAAVKVGLYVWYLECVIQWDSYSSCVKIRCQETDSGCSNGRRTH